MKTKTTKEVHEELAGREGVKEIYVAPHESFRIVTDQVECKATGPARILVNID